MVGFLQFQTVSDLFQTSLEGPAEKVITQTHTSSTAQGGGGSFKNRKPIGEIGCCESGMAEPKH